MERRREGLVTVHFYDVRDAQAALVAIQEQHMQQQFRLGRHYEAVMSHAAPLMAVAPPLPPQTARGLISGRVVWAQFITPVTAGLPDGNNQGTLVIFNLGSVVSASSLKGIFQEFGMPMIIISPSLPLSLSCPHSHTGRHVNGGHPAIHNFVCIYMQINVFSGCNNEGS